MTVPTDQQSTGRVVMRPSDGSPRSLRPGNGATDPARWRRVSSHLLTLLALAGMLTIAPQAAAPARAAVINSCTIAGCPDARAARAGWSALGFPTRAGWYAWPDGQYNYTGGTFRNRERQLPAAGTYNEYDVYPRAMGQSRDAYRIVVDRGTGSTWYTPNHYDDFYLIN